MSFIIKSVLIILVCMVPLLVNAVVEDLFFESQWSYNQINEKGNFDPDDYEFGFEFDNGIYNIYGNGLNFAEAGIYTSSADSIYITLTESTIPERTGMSLSTQWRKDYRDLILSNAPALTNNLYQMEEIVLSLTFTKVENHTQSWGEIKLQFKE